MDWFQIGKGVWQGCILWPCLFSFSAEYIMRNARLDEAQTGLKIAGRNITNLRYVDDTMLNGRKQRGTKEPLQFSSVSSVAQSCPTLCDPMNRNTPGLAVHHQLPEFTQTHAIESVMPSSHLILCRPLLLLPQSLPASKSFPTSQLFTWGGQSTGASALASFLPKKSQGWSPSEWTGWISLQSRGLSRVFSNTTFQKHQFFGAQPSSQSNSHIHTWLLEKP